MAKAFAPLQIAPASDIVVGCGRIKSKITTLHKQNVKTNSTKAPALNIIFDTTFIMERFARIFGSTLVEVLGWVSILFWTLNVSCDDGRDEPVSV